MKHGLIGSLVFCFLLAGCAAIKQAPPIAHEIRLVISAENAETINVEEQGDGISRTMQIRNQEGSLSDLTFTCKDEAYIKIFSALTVADVTNLWNDICVLSKTTSIQKLNLFINSPGGDAFSGLALADQIERAKKQGFVVVGHASGIVASAAIPVLAICTERLAAPGTIFMVHETSIWKWPGRETASDIKSQNALMELLRDRYLSKLSQHSRLTKEEWGEKERETTWFSAEQAKEWGLVDRIE